MPGFVNVDALPNNGVDVVLDVRKDFPWEPGSVSYIFCSHLIEHLSNVDADSFLRKCFGVLEKGGYIDLWTPDLEILAKMFVSASERGSLLEKIPFFYQSNHSIADFINWRLFGNVTEEGMFHKYIYCKESLINVLKTVGFLAFQELSVNEDFLLEKFRHKGIQMGWRAFKVKK